jgi:hypothetical protein
MPPGPQDWWFAEHKKKCGGNYLKVLEPAMFEAPPITDFVERRVLGKARGKENKENEERKEPKQTVLFAKKDS